MSFVNDHELRIIGLSRSGNHALVNWLLSQINGTWCFLNCAEGRTNPFVTARPMVGGRCHDTNDPQLDLDAERVGRWRAKDFLLFSHEDSFLGRACSREFERHHDQWVGPSRRRRDVLILRDPFNLFASRRRARLRSITTHTAARIWKQHAREALNHTRRLRHERVVISYNHWFLNRAYRQRIAHQLELPFTDQGLEQVAQCHGGSSFDGIAYDGRAQQMGVLTRWRRYADDPTFTAIFDQEMLDLASAIFGPLPGIEALVQERPVHLASGL